MIFRGLLQTSSYHLLSKKERKALNLDELAKQTEKEMAEKREEIIARGLPAQVQAVIQAREAELQRVHTVEATHPDHPGRQNILLEAERIKNDYIETQLRKEFIPEWPATFIDPTKAVAHH